MSGLQRMRLLVGKELLEQRRQVLMLSTIATLLTLVHALGVAGTFLLDRMVADQTTTGLMADLVGASLGEQLPTLQDALLVSTLYLGISQYLGACAVLAGHSMLHERQCGTFPFLLLAPLRRVELLIGKVLGALCLPTALYILTSALASLCLMHSDAVARAPWYALPHPAWWVGIGLTGPTWTLACASACTLISAHTADVRTAQQGVWLLVFFATLGLGPMLTATMSAGIGAQILAALVGVLASGTLLYTGALLSHRDIGR